MKLGVIASSENEAPFSKKKKRQIATMMQAVAMFWQKRGSKELVNSCEKSRQARRGKTMNQLVNEMTYIHCPTVAKHVRIGVGTEAVRDTACERVCLNIE